jgi:SAM-dependent methyltransferase
MTVPIRRRRQQFLAGHLNVAKLSVLEIGALDSPMWLGAEAPKRLRYLDWYSSEELYEMHKDKPNRNWDRAVEVDYVVKDKAFSRHIPERFDLVVAHHVIEHIPDPISWLHEVAAVTAPGGRLLMAVPDRRYTFDYVRPLSTVVDFLRAREAQLVMPDYWQSLAAIYQYRPIHAEDCWPGPPPAEKVGARRFDLQTAMRHAERSREEYLDVHCFVFTERSFAVIVRELRQAGMIPWRVVASREVEEGGNEFIVLLVKDDPAG